jgi:hypothetical protein
LAGVKRSNAPAHVDLATLDEESGDDARAFEHCRCIPASASASFDSLPAAKYK